VRRRQFLSCLGSVVAWPLLAGAQQPAMPVIGYLSARSPDAETPLRVPFLETLENSGFRVGRNVAIEYRYAYGREARLPVLAAELVARHVAVFIAFGRGTALAAKAATSTIPIVFASGFDPVSDGLVASLARPGGNATGISLFTTELGPKRLALLRELLPKPGVIAFVVDPNNSTTSMQLREIEAAAETLAQPLLIVQATTEDQMANEFAILADRNIAAILFGAGQYFQVISDHLITLAARYRVPALYEWREFVTSGGLMSYSTERSESARQAAVYAAHILRGDKPADLPVVQSTRFELVINLKTARELGLTIPATLLAGADEVIE
jgi:putative tryptophan/tyrosine transport system substrate-binding protein